MTEVTRKDNIISRGLQGCHRSEMSVLVHSWVTSLQANSLLYGTTDIPAHECTSVYICGLRVCKQTRFCMEPPTSLSVLKSLSPLAFLKIGGADARSVQKTPAGTPKNEYPCSFLGYKFAGANLLLLGTTDVLVGSEKPFTVSFFANRQDRYEARAQINRRRIYDTLRINLCAATK